MVKTLYIFFLILISSESFSQARNYKGKSKSTVLQIRSNIPDANISLDGIFVGHPGVFFETAAGIIPLSLSANGYTSRYVFALVKENQKNFLEVNFLPVVAKNIANEIPAFDALPAFDAANIPGVCSLLQPNKKEFCMGRSSWKDTFLYADPTSNKNTLYNDDWLAQAESVFAKDPTDEQNLSDLSRGLLLRNDCRRIFQVIYELRLAGKNSPAVETAEALCQEISGDWKQALATLEKSAKINASPVAHFHLARLQATAHLNPNDPTAALKAPHSFQNAEPTLMRCMSKNPDYFPCFDLMRWIALAKKDEKHADEIITKFVGSDWKKGNALLRKAKKMIDQNQLSFARGLVMTALDDKNKLELHAMKLFLDLKQGISIDAATLKTQIQKSTSTEIPSILALMRTIRDITSFEITDAFYSKTLEIDPSNIVTRLQYAFFLKQKMKFDRCAQITAIQTKNDDESTIKLQTIGAECLFENGRLKEAANIYESLLKSDPLNGQTAANYAIVIDRLGQKEKARIAYQEALKLSLPENLKRALENRLMQLKSKDIPNEKN